MTRILTQLFAVNAGALLAAFAVGTVLWARGELAGHRGQDSYPLHLYLALFGILFNLGLHCLVFIYFLGTGRWVKEVALAYELPDAPLPRQTRELKRATFPPALLAMLVPIATAAAGMAQLHQYGTWAGALHACLAVATLAVNVWAFRIEYRNVAINVGVIDRVMQEVERIRAERGLPTNAEAWKQEGR
jgi:hypothetical protein